MEQNRDLESIVFEGRQIRRVHVPEWNGWGAVGIDVAEAVGYAEPKVALKHIVDRNPRDFSGETWTTSLVTQGQRRKVTVLSRKGMKKFGMVADTDKAVLFRDWVAQFLTDLEDGKIAVVPGPNADPDKLANRVQVRLDAIYATKAAHRVISEVGGQFYHHINLERKICRRLHGCDPKEYKQRIGVAKSRPVADFEPTPTLAVRSMVGAIFEQRHLLGQVATANLSDQISAVPDRVAAFLEGEIGCSLLSLPSEADIRPAVAEAKKKQKRIQPPDNQQRFLQ